MTDSSTLDTDPPAMSHGRRDYQHGVDSATSPSHHVAFATKYSTLSPKPRP
eukprot:CAMPEP_0119105194 /NCGR_PEP_ID=MMETSP1180-20130426/3231_1 /TAXON_ID=3052 ORGANISM="Chlamydomonas cf sp, Strain CCMP681" /NCGR_SAMPLE_ID=MMETSP1180 /ASSEMBLY_ACC=CAM_ASM_000741 /LENGTH=50 /DNA_ID=CAMNT_0007090195 /DNA_START=107 /DNA_END=259 /DNA_ORIENTATION=+